MIHMSQLERDEHFDSEAVTLITERSGKIQMCEQKEVKRYGQK